MNAFARALSSGAALLRSVLMAFTTCEEERGPQCFSLPVYATCQEVRYVHVQEAGCSQQVREGS